MTYKIFKIYNTETEEVLLVNSTKNSTSRIYNNYISNSRKDPKTPFLKEILELGKDNISYKELEEIDTEDKYHVKNIINNIIQDLKPKYSINQQLFSLIDENICDAVSSNNVEPSLELNENHQDDLDYIIKQEDKETDNLILKKELESKEKIIVDLLKLIDIITEDKPEIKKLCMAYIEK